MSKQGKEVRYKKSFFSKVLDNTIKKCFHPGGRTKSAAVDEMFRSPQPHRLKNVLHGDCFYGPGEIGRNPYGKNDEGSELSTCEDGSLDNEEARALLGRYEYEEGNAEAALHAFEGIDISSMIPAMKRTLARKNKPDKKYSERDDMPSISVNTVSILLEVLLLKSKSLQCLGRFQEAAQSCKTVLDIVESSLSSNNLNENFDSNLKFKDTINRSVELLPELWKMANSPHEAISSYRRALTNFWNLDMETSESVQKQFAVFLLYSGVEAHPPNLRCQIDTSFVPRNNIEEAILLLMVILQNNKNRANSDPSILEHLSFALSISDELGTLAIQIEQLVPTKIDQNKKYFDLAFCYYGKGEIFMALRLLRRLLKNREDPNFFSALLLTVKICTESPDLSAEGVGYARKALEISQDRCSDMVGIVSFLLGVCLSSSSQYALTNSERYSGRSEALSVLEFAGNLTKYRFPIIIYHLSLENAQQRKLDESLYYANHLIKLEGGSGIEAWVLLARIFSALKNFTEAETVINAALDQTDECDQLVLLRTKAKLHVAQCQYKSAIEIYNQLLIVGQVKKRSFQSEIRFLMKGTNSSEHYELEIWHDLAYIYIKLFQWRDVEICISKSKAINPFLASGFHLTALLHEGQGSDMAALKAYVKGLEADGGHVPSLISIAILLRRMGCCHSSIPRSFLSCALDHDRLNHVAWYNLGLLYRAEGGDSLADAAECFQAATILEETAPIEPFITPTVTHLSRDR